MKKPPQFLAHPPNRRRSTKFNVTASLDPAELSAAAEKLGVLAPDGSEVVWRLRAELRFRRESDGERIAVQVSCEVAAVEESKR